MTIQKIFMTALLVTTCSLNAAGFDIPDLLKNQDGTTVTTKEEWKSKRRPEILELFRKHVYGRAPVGRPDDLKFEALALDKVMMDGKALRKRVKVTFSGSGGAFSFDFTAFIPESKKPVPAYLLICNRNKGTNHVDPEREVRTEFWPAEEIVERGYAAIAFRNSDIDPDTFDGWSNGVHQIFQPDPAVRKADSWGTLTAWAWGASRIMDWIESEPLIDAEHVAVVGHSRGGKTALWCGAQDERFALTISNNSGCGGAKLNRMCLPRSEHIARINSSFPHWFCDNFKQYNDNEDALPVDQHMLLALIAPRLLYVASATLDDWAGQPGEYRACELASPVWRKLYRKHALVGVWPQPDTPLHEGHVGYHLRSGKHNLTLFDWNCYMDFTDKHWRP